MINKPILLMFFLLVFLSTSCGLVSVSVPDAQLQLTVVAAEATTASIRATTQVVNATRIAYEVENGLAVTPEAPSLSIPVIDSESENITAGEIILEEIAVVPDDALFFDDFSNNKNGWALTPNSAGTASLVQGRLLLKANFDQCLIVPVPNASILDNFYAQVDVELDERKPYSDDTVEEYVAIGFGTYPNEQSWYGVEDRWSEVSLQFREPGGAGFSKTMWPHRILRSNRGFLLGVESLNGAYTLYVNGEPLETLVRDAPGNTISLGICDYGSGSQTYFDNLLIKEYR